MARATARRFIEREVKPHIAEWEEAGSFPRELYGKAGVLGVLGVLGLPGVGHPRGSGPRVVLPRGSSHAGGPARHP